MKNILVTGGAGFIGSHTVVELYNSGYNPIIIDDFSNSDKKVLTGIEQITGKEPRLYEGKIQDLELLAKIIKTNKIEGVIHFAAFKAVGESVKEPLMYYENNVSAFINLLGIIEESSISNIIFSSSCTVYGEPDKLPVTEKSPIKPAESPYGSTKQMGESILKDTTVASKRLKSLALRYFNPIGAHPSGLIGELPIGTPQNLVPFVTQTAAGIRKELVVHGNDYPTKDGSCIRDYIHVVDLAKAHVRALEWSDKQLTGTYDVCNIGTGNGSSVLEVIKTFEKESGLDLPYRIGPRRNGDVVETYADVSKAERILGWRSEKTLADALADAWRWQNTLNP